ncbi:MAG TPA: DotI/IcmL/TraM family protein [Gammaproteobacteria bacterium]|nr:DotI/IcmL/TraM family protein [Gammaproteobacteria bacterium]
MINNFYHRHFHHIIIGVIISIIVMMVLIVLVLYQTSHIPLPVFLAVQSNEQRMELKSYEEPNLLPDTILRWASKAATIASTYDFSNYNNQLAVARPYFTESGWSSYQRSVTRLINAIVANQLVVNGIVTGTPVISNQGPLGVDYAWQVQMPFLVAYQPASAPPYQRSYFVVLTIVKVPTSSNPQGIGIDQFVM